MEISSQQDLERKLTGLRNDVQVQIFFLNATMLSFVIDKIYYSSSLIFSSLFL